MKKNRALNTKDAAKYIGHGKSTLDKWRAARKVLPFHQSGVKVTYLTADLDAYLESIRIEPAA